MAMREQSLTSLQVIPPSMPPGIGGDRSGRLEAGRTKPILVVPRDPGKIEISSDRFSRLVRHCGNDVDLHPGPRSRGPAATLGSSIHLDPVRLLGLVRAALSPHRSLRGT